MLDHPALVTLEATPEILRGLMTVLNGEDALWKPAPGRFSVAEVLEHLSHVEGHCFRLRIDRSLERDQAAWEPYDPEEYIAKGQYSGRDPEESFAHFEEQRHDNLRLLRALEAAALARTGMHPRLGRITLAELLSEWAFHDLGHIRQVAELVRARKFYPAMGPFQPQYKVNP